MSKWTATKTGDDLIKRKLDTYRMFLFSSPDIFKALDGWGVNSLRD